MHKISANDHRIARNCCHRLRTEDTRPVSPPGHPSFTVPHEDEFIFKHFRHPMNCRVIQPIVSVTTNWVSQPK